MANSLRCVLLAALSVSLAVTVVRCDDRSHKYKDGEAVKLWVNKVGPYNNPQETYNYYYLPFCKVDPSRAPERKWAGLGEALEGNELINSQYPIKFKEDVTSGFVCEKSLTAQEVRFFSATIRRHYWYEFILDDLPMWGFIGDAKEPAAAGAAIEPLIYTHQAFTVLYNADRVIEVNMTATQPVPVSEGAPLRFTYSVAWTPTTTPFAARFKRYLDVNFFEHQIHWLSIFNSFMMVLFLTGIVAVILLRTLRKDYARYATAGEPDDLEALEMNLSDESGWKLVHGDVFRPPSHILALAALVGTGAQLAVLVVVTILITIAGTLFQSRGTIMTTFIVCYALTSVLGGLVSGTIYARHDGRAWTRCALLTACMLPGLAGCVAATLNTIAIGYHSLNAVPFGTILLVLFLWALVSTPLCILGSIAAKHYRFLPTNPCRVKRIPSHIPPRAWWLRPVFISLAAGLLPFGSISIELYFVFTSFWNYKVYFVYGFFLLIFLILLIVSSCVAIVATFLLLNSESYHWPWTAFCSAASTAIYVFVYAIHYFHTKTKMDGFFQTTFYFGYTAMFCAALGIMCGAVGYTAAAMFVRRIYRNIKCD